MLYFYFKYRDLKNSKLPSYSLKFQIIPSPNKIPLFMISLFMFLFPSIMYTYFFLFTWYNFDLYQFIDNI